MKCCRYIGLDFGDKTIGVAVSLNGRVATGVKTIRRKDAAALRPCLKELKLIIREYGINHIVLGFPKKLDGEESARCAETLAFKEKLNRYFKNIETTLWDERLSTKAVSRVFDGKRRDFKNNADQMAAVYILQGYLDGKENQMLNNEPFDENEGDDLVIVNEDGEERPLQILSSNEAEDGIYLLAIEAEAGEVYHFRCEPSADDDDDVILEQIDKEHKDYDRVFIMFKDEYEELGIDIEDVEK